MFINASSVSRLLALPQPRDLALMLSPSCFSLLLQPTTAGHCYLYIPVAISPYGCLNLSWMILARGAARTKHLVGEDLFSIPIHYLAMPGALLSTFPKGRSSFAVLPADPFPNAAAAHLADGALSTWISAGGDAGWFRMRMCLCKECVHSARSVLVLYLMRAGSVC